MLRDETTIETFSTFVEEHEARLRHALTARFGSDVGKEAAADALAYGWEHWEQVRSMENPIAKRKEGVSSSAAECLVRRHSDRNLLAPYGHSFS